MQHPCRILGLGSSKRSHWPSMEARALVGRVSFLILSGRIPSDSPLTVQGRRSCPPSRRSHCSKGSLTSTYLPVSHLLLAFVVCVIPAWAAFTRACNRDGVPGRGPSGPVSEPDCGHHQVHDQRVPLRSLRVYGLALNHSGRSRSSCTLFFPPYLPPPPQTQTCTSTHLCTSTHTHANPRTHPSYCRWVDRPATSFLNFLKSFLHPADVLVSFLDYGAEDINGPPPARTDQLLFLSTAPS
jgi:hypothetical protein